MGAEEPPAIEAGRGALARLEKLPDWPARMTAPVAAAYMGVSATTFRNRFGGIGFKEGSNLLWARAQLDRIIAEQFGLEHPVSATAYNEYDEWKEAREVERRFLEKRRKAAEEQAGELSRPRRRP